MKRNVHLIRLKQLRLNGKTTNANVGTQNSVCHFEMHIVHSFQLIK